MPIKQILALILSVFKILFPFAVDTFTNSGDKLMYEWSADMEFTEEYFIELEKAPDRDFKILNLTDIQIYDEELYHESENGIGHDCLAIVKKVIEDEQPDLITVSGDSFCSTLSTLETIEVIDAFGIPWAPVFGNHEGGNQGTWLFWGAYQLANAKHSLFEYGPKDMGYGNYVINITVEGEVVHTLYMMDTHNKNYFTVNGKIVYASDHLWQNQIEWYEWAVSGNERLAGHPVTSTAIFHIPPYEFTKAWRSVTDGVYREDAPYGELKPEYSDIASGTAGEYFGTSPVNNGFFDKVKELGSTKNIIVGHNHYNDCSILYEGVYFIQSVHTGFGCYYRDDMLGATVLMVSSSGDTDFYNVYYSFINGEWVRR